MINYYKFEWKWFRTNVVEQVVVAVVLLLYEGMQGVEWGKTLANKSLALTPEFVLLPNI